MVINWKKLPEMFKNHRHHDHHCHHDYDRHHDHHHHYYDSDHKTTHFQKKGDLFILGWGYGGMVSLLHEKGASFSEFPQITGNREPKIG